MAATLDHQRGAGLADLSYVISVTFETRGRSDKAEPNNLMNWDAHEVPARYA